jgi:hypothetical protein
LVFISHGEWIIIGSAQHLQIGVPCLWEEKIIEVVDETLGRCDAWSPIAAIVLAATNENISLDGLYYLIRRDPTTLFPTTG